MSGNSIAISRELVSAGLEEKTANAVAEAIVTHSYSSERGLENKIDNLDKRLHNLEVQFVEHRAESRAEAKKNDMRFHILSALIVGSALAIFFKDYLG